jgi:hypothetical protein
MPGEGFKGAATVELPQESRAGRAASRSLQKTPEAVMEDSEKTTEQANQMSGAGCLVRMSWMLVGNVVLAACAAKIFFNNTGFFSPADVVFWPVVAAMIWLRRIDITRMKGQTASGEPATLADWKRYSVLLVIIALLVWAGAHGLAALRA